MSEVVVWADPPPKANMKHGAFAAALRERPEAWAIINSYGTDEESTARSLAANVNHGRLSAFRDGSYEAVTRTVDGQINVYVRYMGGATS